MEQIRKLDGKRKRIQGKIAKLREEEDLAKKARAKRDGTYKSGGNVLKGGFEDADDHQTCNKKRKTGPNVCPHCGRKGHKTKRSKCCPFNPAHPEFLFVPDTEPIALAEVDAPISGDLAAAMDAMDADEMDQLPLKEDDNDLNFFADISWDSKDEFASHPF